MVAYWEPGTDYGYDDVVEYEGTFMTYTVLILAGFTKEDHQVIDIRSSSHIAPRLDDSFILIRLSFSL
jgi:hypothetical protein